MSDAKRPVVIVTESGERREATMVDFERTTLGDRERYGLLQEQAEAPVTPADQVREDLGIAEAVLLNAMVNNDDYSMAALLATAWSATSRAMHLWHERRSEAQE